MKWNKKTKAFPIPTSFVLYAFRNWRFGFQAVKCGKTKTRCKRVVIF